MRRWLCKFSCKSKHNNERVHGLTGKVGGDDACMNEWEDLCSQGAATYKCFLSFFFFFL